MYCPARFKSVGVYCYKGYIVTPGWVTAQDFLFGFAILQAFPGPNFNFAVYLGALRYVYFSSHCSTSLQLYLSHSLPNNPVLGGVLGFIGLFSPGLLLKLALLPAYRTFRDKKVTRSLLRGLNSSASGLVWTSVFRSSSLSSRVCLGLYKSPWPLGLWKVGLLTADSKTKSLETSAYWAVVAGASFAASEWFSIQPPVAIIGGAIAGLIYGGVKGTP